MGLVGRENSRIRSFPEGLRTLCISCNPFKVWARFRTPKATVQPQKDSVAAGISSPSPQTGVMRSFRLSRGSAFFPALSISSQKSMETTCLAGAWRASSSDNGKVPAQRSRTAPSGNSRSSRVVFHRQYLSI